MRFFALLVLAACTQDANLVQPRRTCLESGVTTLAVDSSASLRAFVPNADGFAVFYVDERQLLVSELDISGVARGETRAVGSGNDFRQLSAIAVDDAYWLASNRFVDGRRQIFVGRLGAGAYSDAQLTSGSNGGDDGVLGVLDGVVILAYRQRDDWVVAEVESGVERFRMPRSGTDTQTLGLWPGTLLGRDQNDFVAVDLATGVETRLGRVAQDENDQAIAAVRAEGVAAAFADGRIEVFYADAPAESLEAPAMRLALAFGFDGRVDVIRVATDGVWVGDTLLAPTATRAFGERLGGGLLVALENEEPRVELYRECE